MTVKAAYDELYTQILPNGLYIQRGFRSEDIPAQYIASGDIQGVRGFPVEWAITLIVSVIICEFLRGFFNQLGKKVANESLNKIQGVIKSKKEISKKDMSDIKNVVDSVDISLVETEQGENAYLSGEKEIIRVLVEAGMPSYRAKPIGKNCAEIIKQQIIHS